MKREAEFREVVLASSTVAAAAVPRASRLPRLLTATADPGPALRALKIGVVGLGSVGRACALHLARLGVHTLWLVDRAAYKPESLLTQAIDPAEIGRPKAGSTGELCKRISPGTAVFTCQAPLQDLGFTALLEADAVLLAGDNLAVELEAGQRCLHLQRPLIQASVHGGSLTVQVRTFAFRDASGPCPACAFSAEDWRHLQRETRFSCEGAGAATGAPLPAEAPTMSFSFLCSLAADLALAQLLRLVLGLGAEVADTELEYCAYRHRAVVSPLRRARHCPVDHTCFRRVGASAAFPQSTLRSLARLLEPGAPAEEAGLLFSVGGTDFVDQAVCGCGGFHPVRRFLRLETPLPPCTRCGRRPQPLPFHTHRWAGAAAIRPLLDTPVERLSAPRPAWVALRRAEEAVLVHVPAGEAEERGGHDAEV